MSKTANEILRERLIRGGVNNLRVGGYPSVNEDNILTDEVYSAFFLSMLDDNKGIDHAYDKIIAAFESEIKNLQK